MTLDPRTPLHFASSSFKISSTQKFGSNISWTWGDDRPRFPAVCTAPSITIVQSRTQAAGPKGVIKTTVIAYVHSGKLSNLTTVSRIDAA